MLKELISRVSEYLNGDLDLRPLQAIFTRKPGETIGRLRLLKAVIAREFLNNILNLRFMIGLVLCIVVTVACIMILAHDYRREMKDYDARLNLQDEILDNYATARRYQLRGLLRPQKPPERFRLLIIGIAGNEGVGFFDNNPLPILFPPLDFLFIVTIVMSLLAVLFSHDAIAGERQRGTLRLMISNSISRTEILLGKLIGGAISLIIPFILSLLVGVLYISINPAFHWDGSAWGELGLLTAASITFITLFYLLGLAISTFSRYASTSILNCLFLWVLLILVIPNVSPYISAQFHRIPSIKETSRRELEVERHSIKVAQKYMAEAVKRFRLKYGALFSEFESMKCGGISSFFVYGRDVDPKFEKQGQQRAKDDPEFKAMMDAFRQESRKAQQELERIRDTDPGEDDLHRKAALQTTLAKNLACISPYANLVYIARDLTGTGLQGLEYFKRTKDEYERQLRSYLQKKINNARKNNPEFEEESSLDVSDRPRFVFKEEPLRDKLAGVLPYWGILLLFNVVFFVAAFAGFMRYDVR
ncbi:MAG: ABC transporter permease subunit [Planctomycetota bacterium]|jgi:ABC-type transport system involved in multi-copper enzyme maturation permease subunit